MRAVRAVAFQYEPCEAIMPLLATFRMMANHAIWVGLRLNITSRFKLIAAVYGEFKRYGLHTHYCLNACEIACAILKAYKKNRRKRRKFPAARRLMLKLDNQTYRLKGSKLRIPTQPKNFLILNLQVGKYQRRFLEDKGLRLGSLTITPDKAIIVFTKEILETAKYRSVMALDTNELSLDGAVSNANEVKPIRLDLSEVARISHAYFEKRRRIQRLTYSLKQKRLLAKYRGREQRRKAPILHRISKQVVAVAGEGDARIILEQLKGVRRPINRKERKLNPRNGKTQSISVHTKPLKRRLNTWPFRRLHNLIEYKARWAGITLDYVPAKDTSRTCPMCGWTMPRHGVDSNGQVFTCNKCGWRCNRHLNAALNLLKTQDEGKWFCPNRLSYDMMTAMRGEGEEAASKGQDPKMQQNLLTNGHETFQRGLANLVREI